MILEYTNDKEHKKKYSSREGCEESSFPYNQLPFMGNERETCCKSKVLGKPFFHHHRNQFFFLDPACTRLADCTVVRLCKSFLMTLFKQFSDFMRMI